ncbi:hypothetical protein E2C01_017641 [Portunus trituberculatus]|uniref:Uncharacterized protein n=1 Tax=Portunus trituberculatus TaxID=210409 RepID=A0A5B7DT29_PORTR|nr:hypothetical protein [Portunus trituberculatus]
MSAEPSPGHSVLSGATQQQQQAGSQGEIILQVSLTPGIQHTSQRDYHSPLTASHILPCPPPRLQPILCPRTTRCVPMTTTPSLLLSLLSPLQPSPDVLRCSPGGVGSVSR